MGLKSLVLITLVAGFVLVSAESESLEDLLRRMLSQLEQTKADADALLQTQKINAALAGYTLIRGVVIDSNGKAVSTAGTDFALELTGMEMSSIASAFASNRFDSFTANGVSAEGVTYRMMGVPKDGEAFAFANDKYLRMRKVSFGVSVILLTKNE